MLINYNRYLFRKLILQLLIFHYGKITILVSKGPFTKLHKHLQNNSYTHYLMKIERKVN